MSRDRQTNVRLGADEQEELRAAAEAAGLTVSEYLRQSALEAARGVCPACGGTGRAKRRRAS